MKKLISWDKFFWLAAVVPAVVLKYFDVCLLANCADEYKLPQLLFVFAFAIITKTYCLVPNQLVFHYMFYRFFDICATIFLTQIALEYIWIQMMLYTTLILSRLSLDDDYIVASFLNFEAILFLYYAILIAADPRSIYRLLKDLFGVQQPHIRFSQRPEIISFYKNDPSCRNGKSRTRSFMNYFWMKDKPN